MEHAPGGAASGNSAAGHDESAGKLSALPLRSTPKPLKTASGTAIEFAHSLRYPEPSASLLAMIPARNAKTNSSMHADAALARAASLGRLRDRNDRMILPLEFKRIENMSGLRFDLDACCNASGDNKLCPEFCSPEKSFLAADLRGKHVWLNPPFDQLEQFLAHYSAQKAMSPCDTSACLCVPAWYGARARQWRKHLSGMRLLHQYPKGYHLFTSPTESGMRERMPGIPWPVQIWYDPPQCETSVSVVAGDDPLTMSFECTANKQPCKLLVDTGAKGEGFISLAMAERLKLRVDEGKAVRYRVANGIVSKSHGTAAVSLHMQGHEFPVTCHVIDMMQGYDVILGDRWLQGRAILDYLNGRCIVRIGKRKVTLRPARAHAAAKTATPDSEIAPSTTLSAIEVVRAVASEEVEELFTVLVTPDDALSEGVQTHTAPPALSAAESPSTTVDPARLQAILDRFKSICVDSLPPGLPPMKYNQEAIPTIEGGKPPCPPMFRYSQLELAEMRRQVTELLEKGLIEPSVSPYGAPVLFVKKKGGDLRMCCDWRALNRITVKNRYPLPRIDDMLDRINGAKVFSSIDLCSAYHQVRLVDSDVPKTAFRTPFGHFQFRVLAFGLTNAPSHFQTVINSAFADPRYSEFMCIYLDDILVFSKNADEHLRHIESVFERLEAEGFYVKLRKCEFNKPEVKFLGHIVSAKGISPDPDKVRVLDEWPQPKDLSELRSFLGLANYFRKFIMAYGSMASPLNALISNWRADWTETERSAFVQIKAALRSAPCLAVPDLQKPYEVICDASELGIGAVLMQEGHPVAFESRKYIPAERNYTTTEKELLAVVHAFKVWRCYLEGNDQVTVVTDHKPNTFFQTQSTLSRRQARWSEFLSQFTFEWQYRPGRINVADPLSRAPMLSRDEIVVAALSSVSADELGPALAPTDAGDRMGGVLTDLRPRLRAGYESDAWFADNANTSELALRKGIWYKGDQIVVPSSLRSECVRVCHACPWSGHVGMHKTYAHCAHYFWWPQMRETVNNFVSTCDSCQRVKTLRQRPAGKLQPLPIPEQPWESIGMDWIVALPLTTTPVGRVQGYNAIMVVVDRLTKMSHFIPMHETEVNAPQVGRMLVDNVFRPHGVPRSIVSDRDPKLTSEWMTEWCRLLGIDQAMSTAYHPQTDGQTERVNGVLEDMLRHYVSPSQTDWHEHLSMVEFAYNNSFHESVKDTPFFLNYGFNPLSPLDLVLRPKGAAKLDAETAALPRAERRRRAREKLAEARVPAAGRFTKAMQKHWQRAREALRNAQQRQKHYADKRRSEVSESIEPGSMVLLRSKNLNLKVGSSKFHPRWLGPYKVLEQINPVAFKLELPETMRVHNVFHSSLLRPYKHDGVTPLNPPAVEVDGVPEYEVERILRMKPPTDKSNRSGEYLYLVRWVGYDASHDSWEPESMLTNCPEVLKAFHEKQARAKADADAAAAAAAAKKRKGDPLVSATKRQTRPATPAVGGRAQVAATEPPAPVRRSSRVRNPPPQ